MKRKIYEQLVAWKREAQGRYALLIEGARRIGKSYIVAEFGKKDIFYTIKKCTFPHEKCIFYLLISKKSSTFAASFGGVK